MIIRIHVDDGDREWLIPDWTVPNADGGIVLDLKPRPAGSIELIDAMTCKVVAVADLPRTGPGVLVTYGQTYRGESAVLVWDLEAEVDTMLQEPTPPISSTAQCRAAT